MQQNAGMRIVNAATLVCLRRGVNAQKEGTWQVLLGQNEVVNWLRSSPQKLHFMRYPGEWKFPGGSVDAAKDQTLQQTALRETQEEFVGLCVKHPKLYFFNELLTRPIQQTRHRMHNFIAFQEENHQWLSDAILCQVNENLSHRRREFLDALDATDSFFQLDKAQKTRLSPEIVRVQWFPILDAIAMMLTSLPLHIQTQFRQLPLHQALEMVQIEVPKHFEQLQQQKQQHQKHQQEQEQTPQTSRDPLVCVDTWQAKEFEKYGLKRRDPMFKSMQLLMQIALFDSISALQTHVLELNRNEPVAEKLLVDFPKEVYY